MPYGHIYTIRHRATIATAITILQAKAGATSPFLVLRAWATQEANESVQQEVLALIRKTAAATVTQAAVGTHVLKHHVGDPTPDLSLATNGTGVMATVEGTDGDYLWEEGFNALNGVKEVWGSPENERFHVPAAGIVALKFRTAPASAVYNFGMTIMELG